VVIANIEANMVEHESPVAERSFPFAASDVGPSATYLHALLENSPIATVVLDARHRFSMCNPAFERLFQYTPKQLAAANIDELIAAPEMVEEAANISRTVLQGRKVHMVAQRRRRDGMMVDVEIYGIPLMVDGELAGVYGLYQDVTERNHAQTAFRKISDQLEHLQQEERRRLARDLHDSTSQELAVLNWNLSRLMNLVGERDAALQKLVSETREIASQCSARIRSAAYLLHPPLLGKAGLALAVAWMVEGFEQRSGIHVELEIGRDLGRFADEVEIAIYRVIPEGLANVLRHSGSAEAKVSLACRAGWLEAAVSDRGRNHSCERMMRSYDSRSGVGISGMRERVEQVGGCLRIECGVGGTRVEAIVPLRTGGLNG
jgi:two-component system NarL family sensor kinase